MRPATASLASDEHPAVLERLAYRYPSVLVDAVTRARAGRRIVAVKNVTVNEEFFQGHFPGHAADARRADDRVARRRSRRCCWPAARPAGRSALAARRRQREVPAAGRARRSARAGGHAGPAPRADRRARRRGVGRRAGRRRGRAGAGVRADRRTARAEAPRRPGRHPRDGHRAPGRRRSARAPSSARTRRLARRVGIGRDCTVGASTRRRRLHGDRRRHARSSRSRRSAWRRRT